MTSGHTQGDTAAHNCRTWGRSPRSSLYYFKLSSELEMTSQEALSKVRVDCRLPKAWSMGEKQVTVWGRRL